MSRPNPLFVMGNKRSGSTLITNLLNIHPRIFLSHEADTIWILFQSKDRRPFQYLPHPLDSAMEMASTLKTCKRILRSTLGDTPTSADIVAAFYRIQERLLEAYLKPSFRERAWRVFQEVGKRPKPAMVWRALRHRPEMPRKEALAWVGDKKHVQHIEPDIRAFMRAHFPQAKYIHIIRHPSGVVASTLDASQHWRVMPEYFKGTAAQILEQWALHEEWVLQAKEQEGDAIMSVRLEDLCLTPAQTMRRVFDFLNIEMSEEVASRIPLLVHYRDPNQKYEFFRLPDVPHARQIMQVYGYV